jgi:glycosyltransferase involved in cell wall biosynthesis
LSKLYKDADLLILPSRFDTFGYVVLEAMSHGMPVIAYNCKGPKDIIQHNISGYLVDNYDEISDSVIDYQEKSPAEQKTMHQSAIKRCLDYEPNRIMQQLMQDMGLQWKEDTTNE